ncbi:hypothetical protein [Thalassotalea profundi]|uniref:TolC family protein n=1 Tax=Thalassotalea profundi TaxID=2036687 RepID=A0ABQ3IPF3_9GAMM|nr:hypothetical protein [Thalassotalea profundi]GHE88307.1 hypothetical protein GCM10011501_17140 [Thalassotalea profundi]
MSHCLRYYIFVIVLITHSFNIKAASIDEILWENAQNTYQSTKKKLQDNYQISDVSQILSSKCNIDWTNRYEVAALEAQASALDNTYGLEFRAGYTSQNIEHSINDDDGSTYMELSWDVLRNGLRENQYKATDLKRQAAIQTLSGKVKKQTLDYQCRRYRIGTHFEGMEAYLNLLKLEFMEAIYQVENKAYFSGESYLDELLISEEDIILARQNLERLHNSPFEYKNPDTLVNPPVINVDLNALMKAIEDNKEYLQIRQLKSLQLQDESQYNESFLNGSRFRLFVRKEYDIARTGQDELVAGMRFQIPIVFGRSGNQTESKLNQLENDLNHELWEIKVRTQAAYQSLQEQLERTTKQQYRLMRANEKMRRIESYLAMKKPLDIAAVNVRLRNYIDSAIELIQAKEELYRRVNEMFLVSRISYNPRFIKINTLNETTYRARSGERSAYLWSDDFN